MVVTLSGCCIVIMGFGGQEEVLLQKVYLSKGSLFGVVEKYKLSSFAGSSTNSLTRELQEASLKSMTESILQATVSTYIYLCKHCCNLSTPKSKYVVHT